VEREEIAEATPPSFDSLLNLRVDWCVDDYM